MGLLERAGRQCKVRGWCTGRGGCVRVGVRARTREAGDGGVVDGDNEVAGDVVVATRAESGGVVGSCSVTGVRSGGPLTRKRAAGKERTITTRLGHLDLGEARGGGGESDDGGGNGEAHVEKKGSEEKKKEVDQQVNENEGGLRMENSPAWTERFIYTSRNARQCAWIAYAQSGTRGRRDAGTVVARRLAQAGPYDSGGRGRWSDAVQ